MDFFFILEIHAAAKETVALAEQRFMSNEDGWKFDEAWQDMLNQSTIKVMDAEKQKADTHNEHQQKAQLFSEADKKVQQLEDRFRRSIQRSRPYFDEKQICQDQLETQKGRIQELQTLLHSAKYSYSMALKKLELISEEIHKQRGDLMNACPPGPREPGVGAELEHIPETVYKPSLPDYEAELEKCDYQSLSVSVTTSSAVSEKDDSSNEDDDDDENEKVNEMVSTRTIKDVPEGDRKCSFGDTDLEELKQRVKSLAVRPVEGGDGQQDQKVWESELNATVDRLDRLMMMREKEVSLRSDINVHQAGDNKIQNEIGQIHSTTSLPVTPTMTAGKATESFAKRMGNLSNFNVSMRELPLLARLTTGLSQHTVPKIDLVEPASLNRRRKSLE